MRDAFRVKHPMFNPLWRRVLVVVVTGGWAVFELVRGNVAWGALFGAAVAWCAYEFFLNWEHQEPQDKGEN